MSDKKVAVVKELRKVINKMSKEDFDDFDVQMPKLKKQAYKLVAELAG